MTFRGRIAVAILAAVIVAAVPAAVASARPVAYLLYHVRSGDTLAAVARTYHTDTSTLARLSGIANPDRLAVGTVLKIPLAATGEGRTGTVSGSGGQVAVPTAGASVTTVYTVRPGDTLLAIATRFATTAVHLAALNGLADPDRLQIGQRLVVSGAGAEPVPVAWRRLPAPHFLWPVQGFINSLFGPRWGRMHEGLDIAAPYGAVIGAAAPGVVVRAGWEGGYGRVVVIRHSFGLETVYAHASRLLVRVGQAVGAGQRIALIGASGDATGPHVHFEVRYLDTPENPLPLLEKTRNATAGR